MANFSVPYLKWRDGRPRWEPGPRLRAKGFKGRDLKDEAGRWLGLEAAIAAAREINTQLDTWRAEGQPRRRPPVPRRSARTCEALWEKWKVSADFKLLAPRTQADYANKIRHWLDDDFGPAPVGAVTKPQMVGWWEQTYATRGHAMANGILAVARAMLSYAELVGWREPESNPAYKLKRPSLPPRIMVWTPKEIAHLVATADQLGHASVADAVITALHTGQRQGDVLALLWPRTENGRAVFKQSKTGSRVSVPFTPALKERVEAIRRRRRAGDVAEIETGRHLIVSERTGEGYDEHDFRKRFREVREKAATGDFVSIADKQFLDLRDTAVTRLALAGCTVPEIRAITGHSLASIHQVLKHYLALDDAMADAAIARLKAWMAEEGIAV
ncbi:MAG: tyrosine-type recombinase/integrase [Burkholderiaceae bacterium]